MRRTQPRDSAFTLIELLVVIAILALLTSMLLPSLSKSKHLARKAVCLVNIRHLALANVVYAQDNRDYLVIAAEDLWGTNLRRWHGRRSSVNSAFDPSLGPLISYMGSAGMKECPSFRAEFDFSDQAGQSAGFEAGCGGYGYNQSYLGSRIDLYGYGPSAMQHSARLEEVRRPAQTIMFTDCAYVTTTGGRRTKIAYSFCEPPFWDFGDGPTTMSPDPTIDFRHLNQCNVAWADGHADSRNLDFTLSYQTHSMISGEEAKRYGVGWFGPKSNEWFQWK